MYNLYEEYAVLESEIKALESKKAQLRPHILKKMIDEGLKSMDTSVGKFSITPLKSWTYPEEVTEQVSTLSDEIKAIKAKAESTGEATYETKPSLRFTIAKL